MLSIAIIGAGAAGYMAAITAKRTNPKAQISIFESLSQPLRKVGITGGGRCNVTNSFAHITHLKQAYPRGYNILKRQFKVFDHTATFDWFETHGVPLVTQSDACVFPQSQSAKSIVHCLTYQAQTLGIQLHTNHRLIELQPEAPGWRVTFQNGKSLYFDRIAITTGGAPRSDVLRYLTRLGQPLTPSVPSLFTFSIAHEPLRALMGTVAPHVRLSIPSTKYMSDGILLLTHWGLSGPAALRLSSYAATHLAQCQYHSPLSVHWVGGQSAAQIHDHLQQYIAQYPRRQVGTLHAFDLPTRLWQYLLSRAGIAPQKLCADIGKKDINKWTEALTNDIYTTAGKTSFKEEFVTCGGIDLAEVRANTLESKQLPGLFFAGEVLDIDGITGGFNLQAAWTTGYIVGQNIAKSPTH